MKLYSGTMIANDKVVFEELELVRNKLLLEGVSYQLGPIHQGDRGFVVNYELATDDNCPDAHEIHKIIEGNFATRGITLTITTENA